MFQGWTFAKQGPILAERHDTRSCDVMGRDDGEGAVMWWTAKHFQCFKKGREPYECPLMQLTLLMRGIDFAEWHFF